MTTRKNKKSNKSNKRIRKTRSKRQRGGTINNNIKLIRSSMFGNREAVRRQLEQDGIDVNAKNSEGYTALILASSNGHKEIVEMLLEKGADVNAKDSDGWTALMWASRNGHTETVTILLEEGADVNAKDNYFLGSTALDIAIKKEHPEIVKLLKQYIVAQTLPRHLERQQDRLQVGRVMDSKKMPGDLTHKIITEHFGGKRKTRKSKKSKRKTRKTRRK